MERHNHDENINSEGLEGFGNLLAEGTQNTTDATERIELIPLNSVNDFANVDFERLSFEEAIKYSFLNIDVAYEFYNQYAQLKGFSIRKHLSGRNKNGDLCSKSYVCSRQGLRDSKWVEMVNRKKVATGISRCSCKAEMRIYLHSASGRWVVGYFNEIHSHPLLADFGRIHRSHCKISDADLEEVKAMKKVGIKTSQCYASISERVGGYPRVGFGRKTLYNRLLRSARSKEGDANDALKYMQTLRNSDPGFFWKHVVDSNGRLQHLFWCDSRSRVDYEAFGDVLAFDATYGKNKYKCPVVVFSGVNHHLQTVVFATALVSNELEVTYVWLLEQLLEAMNGKSPKCVITDGALSMRNAIAIVFPQAHHRLCAWHLVKNAGKRVHNSKFLKGFKQCMFSDFDVDVFEKRWELLREGCELQNNEWVNVAYAKKEMWATAYMRGIFFAGLRTTSRCEALHSQMRRYVASRQNLCEFIEQLERCWDLIRYNELRADFRTLDTEPVLVSPYKLLEKSAANIYTREVFEIVQRLLFISGEYKVLGSRATLSNVIFVVVKYPKDIGRWHVTYIPTNSKFFCDCKRMETFGLPCVHIFATIREMNLTELPDSVVLDRWTMKAKEFVGLKAQQSFQEDDPSLVTCRYTCLMNLCRTMCASSSISNSEFTKRRDMLMVELNSSNGIASDVNVGEVSGHSEGVQDPSGRGSRRAGKRCSVCHVRGHNKRSCPGVLNDELVDENVLDPPFQDLDMDGDSVGGEGMSVHDEDSDGDDSDGDDSDDNGDEYNDEDNGEEEEEDHYDAFEDMNVDDEED